MKWMIAFTLIIVSGMASAEGQRGCHGQEPCVLGERSYHVREPDGWDGATPLPVLLHFHGWSRQGTLIVQHQRISGATRRRDVLLVAPNGLRKTWDFWRPGSQDTAFARAVLNDIKARYPVIEDKVFVSGYSWGANMAWRFVCEDGDDIAALLAIAGTLDQTERCISSPREVRQVYGLNDQVLEFPYGPGGDKTYPVALWRQKFECGTGEATGSWKVVDFLTLNRTVWDSCKTGRVSLDLHPGGHFIPHGWIGRQLDELLGLPLRYP
ncbi:MAG: polyhydroxybutyrate depolymerase [Pseudomonadota bacterium]